MVGSKVFSASCTSLSVVGVLPATGVCSGRESVSAESSVVSAGAEESSSAGISTTTGVLAEDAEEAGSSTASAAPGRQLTERERVSNRARVRLIGCIVGVVPFSSDGSAPRGSRGKMPLCFHNNYKQYTRSNEKCQRKPRERFRKLAIRKKNGLNRGKSCENAEKCTRMIRARKKRCRS